jgi:hypothetical protein
MAETKSKYIGEEFVEEEGVVEEKGNDAEGLYDLVLPPGVPYKIILEVIDKFNLEVTSRRCALKTIDVDSENLLVLRGELESVNNAHDYIYKKMSEKYNYKK